jgi:hypothetical protein
VTLNVVDLFCGLKGWSQPFADRGHATWTSDYDAHFQPDSAIDVRALAHAAELGFKPYDRIDVLLASPPCETFSMASLGHHWGGGFRAYEPKTEAALVGIDLVRATLRIIEAWQPTYAIIENPRGVLRKLSIIPSDPVTVWYCHYGETRAKPTDLWGMPYPTGWEPRPPCHNRRAGHAADCCCTDHEAAPRGAKTGTQGLNRYDLRSRIPYDLALSVCDALERSC